MSMRLAFSVLLAIVAGALLLTAFEFGTVARRVPVVVLAPTLLLLLAQVVVDLRFARLSPETPPAAGAESRTGFLQAILPHPEIAAVVVAIAIGLAVDLLGVAIAVPLLLGAYLVFAAGATPMHALVAALAMLGLIDVGLGRLLGAMLPDGRLLHWIGL